MKKTVVKWSAEMDVPACCGWTVTAWDTLGHKSEWVAIADNLGEIKRGVQLKFKVDAPHVTELRFVKTRSADKDFVRAKFNDEAR